MDSRSRELLADLLLAWEDALRAGHDVPAAELARDCPDLVEPLERRIRVLKATSWLDHPKDSPPENDFDRPPGGRLLGGRYRLDERVAVGGFAEVWRGFDTGLQRVVAVKIPKAGRIAIKDAFLAEARRVARLRHPAIASVYDVGTEGDQCFIISEFMDGGSLAEQLARGTIEPVRAIRWVGQIAHALDFAHRAGVIHRDVKPANILLSHHDDAVLADFGIAQSATKAGMFAPSVGTLRYMAPEQFQGEPIGPAADIYSLGIVLHESLTGRTPHSRNALTEILSEVTGDGELQVARSLTPALAAVCRRAIRRDPSSRHQTAAAFAADLRTCEPKAFPPRMLRRNALALLASVFVMAASITLLVRRPMPSPHRTVSTVPAHVFPATKPAPLLEAEDGAREASLTFLRIKESLPYVVEARDMGHYGEWQEVPATYLGPLKNGGECFVTYRFDAASPIVQARLIAGSRCWDFTTEPGGVGRGAAAIEVSRDGTEWLVIRDTITGPVWAGDWTIDEPLPDTSLGGRSLWVRVRLLTDGSPNTAYSVAQFGRNRDDPSQPAFGIVAELKALIE